eukprot:202959-Amphidinium_carterae.1
MQMCVSTRRKGGCELLWLPVKCFGFISELSLLAHEFFWLQVKCSCFTSFLKAAHDMKCHLARSMLTVLLQEHCETNL